MKKLLPLLFFLVPLVLHAEAEPLFNILNDGTGSGTAPRACVSGDSPTARNGLIGFSFRDSSGNLFLPLSANDFGASSSAIRVASQIGNATGAAAFNSGTTSAQTLRTASNLYDASANALTTRSYNSVRPLDVYMPQIGSSSVTHTRKTLTANTSTQIAATNTNRKWLYISNQSGATIFIKFGVTAVINEGIEISNKTLWKMSAVELYLGIINVIVGSNNRTIEVIEASL